MIIIVLLQYLLLAVFGFLLLYQLLLNLLAFKGKRIESETKTKLKFAVVIPAHNEEQVLSKTIYSSFGILYPKQLYDLIVIADNCTDNTVKIARDLGVTVLERKNLKLKGKGYALRWAFDRILYSDKSYDAVVVLDADSLISGNFLNVMNSYLEQGSEVVQSSDLVLPQPGNWGIETTRIGYLIYNHVKPLGRKVLGFQTGLRGNGMCFRADLLKKIPWQAWSLTEDLEYGLILMLHDVKIDFAPEATVWAHMPVKMVHAESQRARWETGRFEIMRSYAGRFLKEALRQRSLKHFDIFIDLITPPLVTQMLFVSLMSFINLMLWISGLLQPAFFLMWIGLLFLGVLHLFLGLLAGKADRSLYTSILHIPLYVAWKIKVYLQVFISGKEVNWIKTTRDH